MTQPIRVAADDRPDEHWSDPARGTLSWRTLLSGNMTGTDGLVCGIAEIAPGQNLAPHSHAAPEIYFGLEGEGDVVVDGHRFRLSPGVAIHIPGHAVHGVPAGDHALRWFYVFASDSFDQITYRFVHEQTPASRSIPE